MNDYNARVLAALIDRALEDGGDTGGKITKRVLVAGAKGDIETLEECIAIWQIKGWLRLLKAPVEAADDDFCVEMFRFLTFDAPPTWTKK